jgi:hypothetical protein
MSRRWRRTRARARRARDSPPRTNLIRQEWLAFFIEFSTSSFLKTSLSCEGRGASAGWPPLADAVEAKKNWALHRRKARGSTAGFRLHHGTKSCQQYFATFNLWRFRRNMKSCCQGRDGSRDRRLAARRLKRARFHLANSGANHRLIALVIRTSNQRNTRLGVRLFARRYNTV